MDLCALPAMSGAMALETDADTLELSRALCTRAGMLLEDTSARVILLGDLQQSELSAAITEARINAGRADKMLAAAEAVLGRQAEPR